MLKLSELTEDKFQIIKSIIQREVNSENLSSKEWGLLHDFLICVRNELVKK